jgi:hypothetical protein
MCPQKTPSPAFITQMIVAVMELDKPATRTSAVEDDGALTEELPVAMIVIVGLVGGRLRWQDDGERY